MVQRYISFPFLQEKINTKNVRNRIKAPRKQKTAQFILYFIQFPLPLHPLCEAAI